LKIYHIPDINTELEESAGP